MVRENSRRIVSAVFLLLLPFVLLAQESEPKDSLIRLLKGSSVQLIEKPDGSKFRKAVDATFLHNGTYLICDSALWNVDNKLINAFGHVQVIQDETILTSDKMDYLIDEDLVQFRGGVVQLTNKKNNTLRTRNLDYNTKDSIAIFRHGASMKDEDGQIIESIDGKYESAKSLFTFENNVNMFTDSIFVKTSKMEYDSDRDMARFVTYIDFWKDTNMLSAQWGWYNHAKEVFFFTDKVHALGEAQEAWSDSLYYYRAPGELMLLGNAQLQDTVHNVAALADYVLYQDTLSMVTLKRNAAVAVRQESETGQVDTVYIGADKLVYQTKMMFQIPDGEKAAAKKRRDAMFGDPVTEYRAKAAAAAAEAAKRAQEERDKNNPALAAARLAAEKAAAQEEQSSPENAPSEQMASPEQAPAAVSEMPAAVEESSSEEMGNDATEFDAAADSVMAGESLAVSDSVSISDTTAVADTVEVLDSTKVGFALGLGHVKIWRENMQVRCDSLLYNDLDSIARFHIDPIVWNDGNRQYTSDSLFVLVMDGGVDRASLQSNAFILIQEDTLAYDQIKGMEVMAYFDSTAALKRFDALGGANAIFYLEENGSLVTVNRVSCKMLSANLSAGNIEKVYYYDSPNNDAFPRAQFEGKESRMKGMEWRPQERPKGKSDITPLVVRKTERQEYESHPKTTFIQTDIYFPGYMDGVYREMAARDSLAKLPKPKVTVSDSIVVDTVVVDTVAVDTAVVESPVNDSLIIAPSVTDSVKAELDTAIVKAPVVASLDSTVVASPVDTGAVAAPSKAELAAAAAARKAAAAAARHAHLDSLHQAKIEARDLKWSQLDSLDSLKQMVKDSIALEKKRDHTRKALKIRDRQIAEDTKKLETYIKRFERRYARKEAALTRKNSRKKENGKDN